MDHRSFSLAEPVKTVLTVWVTAVPVGTLVGNIVWISSKGVGNLGLLHN